MATNFIEEYWAIVALVIGAILAVSGRTAGGFDLGGLGAIIVIVSLLYIALSKVK